MRSDSSLVRTRCSLPTFSQCWPTHATPQVSNQEDDPKGPLIIYLLVTSLITGTSTKRCSDTWYAWFGRPKKTLSFFLRVLFCFCFLREGDVCRREEFMNQIRYDLPLEGGVQRLWMNEWCWASVFLHVPDRKVKGWVWVCDLKASTWKQFFLVCKFPRWLWGAQSFLQHLLFNLCKYLKGKCVYIFSLCESEDVWDWCVHTVRLRCL